MAGFPVELRIDDLAFDPADSAAFGIIAQEQSVEPGVEVERVSQLRQRQASIRSRARVAAERGGHGAHRPFGDVRQLAALALAQIELVEMDSANVLPVRSERMEIAFADRAPVDELDAELERALGRREELVLVDPEHGIIGD